MKIRRLEKKLAALLLLSFSAVVAAANYYIQIAIYGGQYSHYNFPTDNDMAWIGANIATTGFNAALPAAAKLKPGDTVTVQYVDGVRATFDVTNPTSPTFPLGQNGPKSVEGTGGAGGGGTDQSGGGGYGGGAGSVTVVYRQVEICMGGYCVTKWVLVEILINNN